MWEVSMENTSEEKIEMATEVRHEDPLRGAGET